MHDWFQGTKIFSSSKTLNVSVLGVYPKAIDWNIALHSWILILAMISEIGSQKNFKKWGQLDLTSDTLNKKENLSVHHNIQVYCLWTNTPPTYLRLKFFEKKRMR